MWLMLVRHRADELCGGTWPKIRLYIRGQYAGQLAQGEELVVPTYRASSIILHGAARATGHLDS